MIHMYFRKPIYCINELMFSDFFKVKIPESTFIHDNLRVLDLKDYIILQNCFVLNKYIIKFRLNQSFVSGEGQLLVFYCCDWTHKIMLKNFTYRED